MASLELPWTGEAPFLVLRTGDSLVATTRLPLLFASLGLQNNRNTFLVTTSTEQLKLQSHQLWICFRGLRSPQRAYLWPKGQFAHAFQVECPLEAKGCHITSGSGWTTRKLTLERRWFFQVWAVPAFQSALSRDPPSQLLRFAPMYEPHSWDSSQPPGCWTVTDPRIHSLRDSNHSSLKRHQFQA